MDVKTTVETLNDLTSASNLARYSFLGVVICFVLTIFIIINVSYYSGSLPYTTMIIVCILAVASLMACGSIEGDKIAEIKKQYKSASDAGIEFFFNDKNLDIKKLSNSDGDIKTQHLLQKLDYEERNGSIFITIPDSLIDNRSQDENTLLSFAKDMTPQASAATPVTPTPSVPQTAPPASEIQPASTPAASLLPETVKAETIQAQVVNFSISQQKCVVTLSYNGTEYQVDTEDNSFVNKIGQTVSALLITKTENGQTFQYLSLQ